MTHRPELVVLTGGRGLGVTVARKPIEWCLGQHGSSGVTVQGTSGTQLNVMMIITQRGLCALRTLSHSIFSFLIT